jgi:probable F420-dependent oxidoreductase
VSQYRERISSLVRGFRFAVLVKGVLDRDAWHEKARRVESLGYSALVAPDHATPHHLASIPAMMAATEVTTTLRVSSLVMGNDFRNPMMLAKEAATIDVLSGGRYELALGTGWYPADYEMLGIELDSGADRVSRLAEAVALIKRLWTEDNVDENGRWYRARNATVRPRPIQRPHPPILIGGRGRKLLELAGRAADIVSIQAGSTAQELDALIAVVRGTAGDRFPQIELNATCDIAVTNGSTRDGEVGANADGDNPLVLHGSLDSLRQQLLERRDRFGLTYYVLPEQEMEAFAPLARELASV